MGAVYQLNWRVVDVQLESDVVPGTVDTTQNVERVVRGPSARWYANVPVCDELEGPNDQRLL